jgi:membrane protein
MDKQIDSQYRAAKAKKTRAELASRLNFPNLERHIWAQVQHSPLASMWNLRGVSVRVVLKRTWNGIDEENLFGRASQLAYSFFSAVFPALIAMSSIMGMIARSSGNLYIELLERIGRLVPPAAFSLVVKTFSETEKASTKGKVTLGLVVALFSASVGISALQDTLNTVYKVKETRAFWMARLEAMGLTILVALIVLGALLVLFAGDFGAKYVISFLSGGLSIAIRVLAWILASLLMILSFQVMYYFCPDVPHRTWRWFTPGGLVCLLGWIIGSMGLRIYLHYYNSYSVTYGSLGAVVILLLWFYVTGIMILLGGEVNSEIEHAVAEHQLKTGECSLPPQSALKKVDVEGEK